MPIVTIHMVEGRSADQKRRLIAAVTDALVDIIGANRNNVQVLMIDMPRDSWGRAGQLQSDEVAAGSR